VLVESYAVLTRLPSPHRLAPMVARDLLHRSFGDNTKVVNLHARAAWPFLVGLPERGIRGGASYDALIVACALQGGATRLLTFNERDFTRIAPDGLEIVVPE
jgi:predicted nucleic acid-binding protein